MYLPMSQSCVFCTLLATYCNTYVVFVTQCYVAYCYQRLSARVGISGVLLLPSIATLVSGVGSMVLICPTHSIAATAVTRKWAQLR